jgi:hypothetical protein
MEGSKVCTIPLTQGYFAIVDADDYENLSQYKWHAGVKGDRCYAYRKKGKKLIAMHREILNAPTGMHCDHINHNGLDNRKANLRLCTPQQNLFNQRPHRNSTSRYKGVYWSGEKKKWRAEIKHNGRKIHIGYFDYEADAAIAYDDYAAELFGEFAWLNHQHRPEICQWLTQTHLFEDDAPIISSPNRISSDILT